MRRRRFEQRGAMLVLALGLLGVLWFVVLAFSHSAVEGLRLARHSLGSERATWAAESGLRLTVLSLSKDPNFTPSTSWVKMAHTPDTYKVVVSKATNSPVPIPANHLYVHATGRDRSGITRRVAAVVKPGGAKTSLNFSVFANTLSLNGGCRIDSFDSTVSQWIRGNAANVATNSVTAGAISLVGGSWIQGTIQVGVGGRTGSAKPLTPTTNSANVVWKDWSCWSLDESQLTSPLEFANVSAPAAGTAPVTVDWRGADVVPGSYADLRASGGGEVRLTGGTYVFRSINLTGGARLSFTGKTPATVYVTQDFDLSGGTFNNTTAVPRNVVFMLAKGVKGKMTGGAQSFAVVYGPEAEFSLNGGTDLYGAIVAKTVTLLSGASIHYDVDLAKNPPAAISGSSGGGGASVVSWQRY